MPDPTRLHPDQSFPTADPPPAADTRSVGEPTHDPGSSSGEPTPACLPTAPAGYELLAEIGRGGMGVVYRGRDTTLVRDVAVKLLQDRYTLTSLAARRFVDEAKITGQLQHPGIPPVHEVGELPDGRPFLVMKLIKGRTLADIITEGAANHGSLIAAFEQVCQAVAYAHNHGVVHRDLKPANVMVGAFGEVQVMDWGLAKFRSETRADSAEATIASTFHDPRTEADEDLQTRAGSFLGTPAYMSPEQAIGAIDQVDERSDVFGLGAILCAILTGEPPFVAATSESTRQLAAQTAIEPAYARLDGCGAEPALVALCKRCLAGDRAARFRNAGEVAAAVHTIRVEVEERARQAELDRARAELQAAEQHKRRRVQLALFGAVLLLVVGGGAVAWWQDSQATARKAERERDEEKRQADLRAADAEAQQQQRVAQRQTRAIALADALVTADTAGVPRLIDDLKEFRDLTGAQLRELAAQPVGTKPGLHARLALLADEPGRAAELAAYLPLCQPEELLTIRQLLTPHAAAVAPGLWAVLADEKADSGKRLRAACALAGLAPTDPRWVAFAPAVAGWVVRSNPTEVDAWIRALEPVRFSLLPELVKLYPAARDRIRSGKIADSELAPEAAAFELTAGLLARYAFDRPMELAELVMSVDGRHHALFAEAIQKNKLAIIPVLKPELGKQAIPQWAGSGEIGPAVAAAVGAAAVADWLDPDPVIDALAKRQANAAAVLVTLGEAESVWPMLKHSPDPSTRSYLVHRLGAIGADPLALIRRFRAEQDVSAKRAVLLALGEFPAELVPATEREPLAASLLALYRAHPDPGLHAAIDWLLRQKWGKAAEVAAIDAELAAAARGRVVARAVPGAVPVAGFPVVVGPLLPAPAVAVGKDWFVNGEGQTFAVVRGPVEFTLGSPATEPGRIAPNEPAHRKRIGRTFAMATKEVTVAEFLRFRPDHDWIKRYSPGADTPAVAMTWYQAAEYCNWLSEREGIPADQWCYEPAKGGTWGPGMAMKEGHLKLTGYRLPTEAEWEYACRSGAATARYYGRSEELLPRYGWFAKNSDDRAWPVGSLKPNDLGLFDMLGNALEWVEDPAQRYVLGQQEDSENKRFLQLNEQISRLLRGGSFYYLPVLLRCAVRVNGRPGNRNITDGFRPARTLLD